MKTKFGLVVYLFEPFYQLYKDKFITPKFILSVIEELRNEEIEPLRKAEFDNYARQFGGGGRVAFTFPEELYKWYSDMNLNKKRGLWLALHYKLFDKLNQMCYNINKI